MPKLRKKFERTLRFFSYEIKNFAKNTKRSSLLRKSDVRFDTKVVFS